MSYQVLARKWRPQSFQTLVGQEHVLRALVNALEHDRLHHAYLFTGTRGVGKTTIARILAKCLNCDTGVTATPCGVCSSCREIEQGRFVDLIEVDAASRTKVEDTRELLENVQYAPTRGRYKVYLIDEVHMLSGHSFNALLKTLEEPPPHVKFLLATTDPQKVPVTVLSRCLQFNLKRLAPDRIAGHLAHILGEEGIPAEPDALFDLALAADGSMRDALSLLDQAIAFGNGRVEAAEVRSMLGTLDRGRVFELLELLAEGDAAAVLARCGQIAEQSPDFQAVLGELLTLLQRLAVAQQVPEAVDDSLGDREKVLALAHRIPAEDVQLFYQIGLLGRRDLPLSPEPRGGFEMVLLRMLAFRPELTGGERLSLGAQNVRSATLASVAPERSAPVPIPSGSTNRPAPAAEEQPPVEATEGWAAIVGRLGLSGMALQVANHCHLEGKEGQTVRLALDPSQGSTLTGRLKERLREALSRYYGEAVKLEIRVAAPGSETPAQQEQRRRAARQKSAEASITEDANVQAILDAFDATVVPGSVKPVD